MPGRGSSKRREADQLGLGCSVEHLNFLERII